MKHSCCPTLLKLWLLLSALLLWVSCAGVQPEPTFTGQRKGTQVKSDPTRSLRSANTSARQRMALAIRQFLGAPYVWGGTSPQGVDCSGLVVAVYAQTFGMDLPHSAAALFRMGTPVSRHRLRFGDLVFFTTRGGPTPGHVGIYLDKGVFVHASMSQGVVAERLDKPYYKRHWAGARRLVTF